jgi:hypothetical protein
MYKNVNLLTQLSEKNFDELNETKLSWAINNSGVQTLTASINNLNVGDIFRMYNQCLRWKRKGSGMVLVK